MRLQGQVNDLVGRYESTINDCANQLSAIGDDGLPEEGSPAWQGLAGDTLISAIAASAESYKFNIEEVVKRFYVRIFGVEFDFKYSTTHTRTVFWDWKSWKPQPHQSGSYLQRFSAALRETFLGPPKGNWGPTTVVKPHGMQPAKWYNPFSWFDRGRETSSRTYTGVTAIGRAVGRGLFVAGVAFNYFSEHEKMDKRFREQHPELTAAERQGRVIETAAVRTGSQVLASAAAGAAVGSALPVAGTLVGLAVGVGVGLAMSWDPDGDGKSLGDNIADAAEAGWNTLKKLFGGG